ncbi:hypothetical protein FB45DRAFT_741344 [Roridomyces roridus]|uniref:Uncharacterized protein n=1 Tax=Roridomyces roridus TaxID=1738132 RepID=A0AAD7FS53_9AGAR|nr:hypothetical protein FB45DRAFT_741344 [Roridomyces roridus]
MFAKVASLVSIALFAGRVAAICPGFNFGIGNAHPSSFGNGINHWNVYNDNCDIVDGLTTNQNPCSQGIFGYSPAPIHFNEYTSTTTGLRYACRPGPNPDS